MSFDDQTLVDALDPEETSPGVESPEPETAVAGRTIGRYLLVDLLGSGGMGAVYRAYDPELDRMVAIKLVLEGGSESHQLRLQREAQAIAKLSHPNVVQVFDVGRVDEDGAVFIAMEYVAGTTLRAWLDQEQRSHAKILEVFIRAGEGLAAAHERGLIHRDFKPENVLVDGEGRPRVVDFGLAKAASDSTVDWSAERSLHASMSGSGSGSSVSVSVSLDSRITRDGAQVGTPAYMPPEQYSGLPTDARSDTFSFAAALWEALFGQLPFEGSTAGSYALAVIEGERREPPRDAGVARHIITALDRALAVEPDARHPDMGSLLAALRDDPAERRRRGLSFGLGALALTVTLGAALRPRAEPVVVDVCADAGARIESAWQEERAEKVQAALRATDRPFAAATASRVVAGLDLLAQDWSVLALEQCRRDADEPLYLARGACLDGVHARLGRLAAALEKPSTATVEHAVDAVASIQAEFAACRDLAELAARADRLAYTEDAQLAAVADQIGAVDEALVLGDVGAAIELEAEIAQPPREGGWPAELILDRARLAADLQTRAGEFESAQTILLDASQLVVGAERPAQIAAADFHAELADLAWELGDLDGLELGLRRALRLTERVYGPDHPATHLARAATGHAPVTRGDYEGALERYRAGAEGLAVTSSDNDLDRLTVEGWIAEALDGMSRHAEAIPALERLYTRYVSIYGETHPLTLERLESLGRSRLRAGDHQGALQDFDAALVGFRADPSWRETVHEVVLLGNIGAALTAAELWDEAERRLLEALERVPVVAEDMSLHRTALEANLAVILNAKAEYTRAHELLSACVERIDAQGSDGSHNGVMIRLQLARTLLELERAEESLVRGDEALARAQEAGSKALIVRTQLRRAQALDHLERPEAAEQVLRSARKLVEGEAGAETWLESIEDYEALRARRKE